MANVIFTLKIMPVSPDVKLDEVSAKAAELVKGFGAEVGKEEIAPIAFGLKALKLICVMDESKGSTEPLEGRISELEDVQSVEVTDVRRAIG